MGNKRLTLNVLSPIIMSVSLGKEGGSIGRSEDNTLILPDREKNVSRHHASISYENDSYYLMDTSLYGTFINGHHTPLHHESISIENGTLLKIGEYELSIVIIDGLEIIETSYVKQTSINPDELFFRELEGLQGLHYVGSIDQLFDSEDNLTLRNCMFAFQCLAKFHELTKVTADGSIRFCTECKKQVFYCKTDEELLKNVKLNRCVAILQTE